jgi:hypothetical protein
MTQTQDLPQPNDGGNQLDLGALTKFGAVSAALAYATGMLAINTYLHKLGIADFSFAKPKLILTGVSMVKLHPESRTGEPRKSRRRTTWSASAN